MSVYETIKSALERADKLEVMAAKLRQGAKCLEKLENWDPSASTVERAAARAAKQMEYKFNYQGGNSVSVNGCLDLDKPDECFDRVNHAFGMIEDLQKPVDVLEMSQEAYDLLRKQDEDLKHMDEDHLWTAKIVVVPALQGMDFECKVTHDSWGRTCC
jgi:hypothetical protein